MTTSHAVPLLSLTRWLLLLAFAPTSLAAAVARPVSLRDPPCTASLNWLGDHGLNPMDCEYAIRKFWRIDVVKYQSNDMEFVGLGGQRYSKLPAMRTPRRYRHGKMELPDTWLELFPS